MKCILVMIAYLNLFKYWSTISSMFRVQTTTKRLHPVNLSNTRKIIISHHPSIEEIMFTITAPLQNINVIVLSNCHLYWCRVSIVYKIWSRLSGHAMSLINSHLIWYWKNFNFCEIHRIRLKWFLNIALYMYVNDILLTLLYTVTKAIRYKA